LHPARIVGTKTMAARNTAWQIPMKPSTVPE